MATTHSPTTLSFEQLLEGNHDDSTWLYRAFSSDGPEQSTEATVSLMILLQSNSPSESQEHKLDAEPLPYIDYTVLHNAAHCVGTSMPPRALKRLDYLIDARKYYYRAQINFVDCMHRLQDALVFSEDLDKALVGLINRSFTSGKDYSVTISEVETLRRRSMICLRDLCLEERQRRRIRDKATYQLSAAKMQYLSVDLPILESYMNKFLETMPTTTPSEDRQQSTRPSLEIIEDTDTITKIRNGGAMINRRTSTAGLGGDHVLAGRVQKSVNARKPRVPQYLGTNTKDQNQCMTGSDSTTREGLLSDIVETKRKPRRSV